MTSVAESAKKKLITEFLCALIRNDPMELPDVSGIDFDAELLEQAQNHGVATLLCYLLQGGSTWDAFPGHLQKELLSQLRLAVALEMVRANDLADLLSALGHAGIPTLILKGGALAYSHYPAPYLRTRGDTDILVGPGNIRRIKAVFQELGYRVRGRVYKSHQFNAFITRFGGAINYDVHWRASNNARFARVIDFEDAKRQALPIEGIDGAYSLNPVHALLLACMHRAGNPRHDADKLIWINDIHLLVSAMSESELREFSSQAVEAGVQVECLEGIERSRECFATRVSADVLDILKTPLPAGSVYQRFADSSLGLIIDDLKQLTDTRSRLGLIREYLYPGGDYLLQRYGKEGSWWVPLLYARYLFVGFFERVSLR